MPRRTGIILACDLSDSTLVYSTLEPLMPYIDLVKVGLEAMTAEISYGPTVASFIREAVLGVFNKDVMWDMKLHDISNTVEAAAKNIVARGSKMFTLHAAASDRALELAAKAAGQKAIPLAVTVLTDLDDHNCQKRFDLISESAVSLFASNAFEHGIRGFVCSAREARIILDTVPNPLIVTPGIRPAWASVGDQKRVMTPAEAAKAGADYIVVGRPILQPPNGITPLDAVKRIRYELDEAA